MITAILITMLNLFAICPLTECEAQEYFENTELKTPRTAVPRNRNMRYFYAHNMRGSIYAGREANKIPAREICPPPVRGFERLAPYLKSSVSTIQKTYRGFIMEHNNHHAPKSVRSFNGKTRTSLSRPDYLGSLRPVDVDKTILHLGRASVLLTIVDDLADYVTDIDEQSKLYALVASIESEIRQAQAVVTSGFREKGQLAEQINDYLMRGKPAVARLAFLKLVGSFAHSV